jgi:hypothetical protein
MSNPCLKDKNGDIFNPKIPRYEGLKGVVLFEGSTTTGGNITENGELVNFKDYDAVLVEVNLYNRQAILISNPNSSSIQFLQNDWGDTVYFVQAIVNMNEDSFTITSTQTYIYGGAVGKRNGSASVKKIIGFKKLIK